MSLGQQPDQRPERFCRMGFDPMRAQPFGPSLLVLGVETGDFADRRVERRTGLKPQMGGFGFRPYIEQFGPFGIWGRLLRFLRRNFFRHLMHLLILWWYSTGNVHRAA